MGAPRVQIDLQGDAYGFSVEFSLDPVVDAWERLVAYNAASRLADEQPFFVGLRVRTRCPFCGAGPVCLTVVDNEEGYRRACRSCKAEFPVEA